MITLVRINSKNKSEDGQEWETSIEAAEKTLKRQSARGKRKCWEIKDTDKFEYINGRIKPRSNSRTGKKAVQSGGYKAGEGTK